MRIRHLFPDIGNDGEVIAFFGDARLVKTLDCKYELRGDSNADRASAQEWISMFMHEGLVVPTRAESTMSRK
ncbi:MAG: hypothetical protein KA191_13435 [Verrucomicrobia bacterium]|jgi:hypothetical protein|nr:hypothetical protein [Verrucomicrobiota bacterium]HOH40985.1 hypothetical protein [Verrucomicrobiota bacterium]HOR72814.1 hypothetical protein [Verrucomicrobiota bacterium]HPK99373.1 hypothetical protein [Verrucomicrobiota bacterium]HQK02082.1 hypothetical protein [Verrucomicrobiota bacterium]